MPLMPPRPARALLLTLALAACNRQPAPPAPAPSASASSTSAHATAQATQSTTSGHAVKESTDAYEFSYAWPAAADALSALRAQLAADEAKTRATLIHDAAQGQQEAAKDKVPFHPYAHWQEWQVVTDLPAWLSLSADVSTYEGGAHPNHGFDALLWDRQANRRRAPLDLFVSKTALSRAIRKDFCAALDKQRAQKRGEPVKDPDKIVKATMGA